MTHWIRLCCLRATTVMATAVLTTACAINTEPIASTTPDAGFGAQPDAGFSASDSDAGAPAAIACDIDLHCSEDCPDDLDCVEGDNEQAEMPDYDGLVAQSNEQRDTGERSLTLTLEPGEDAWLALPQVDAETFMHVEALDAPVVLAIYMAGGDWPLMIRSHDVASIDWTMGAEQPLVLRVHALEALEEQTVDLRWE